MGPAILQAQEHSFSLPVFPDRCRMICRSNRDAGWCWRPEGVLWIGSGQADVRGQGGQEVCYFRAPGTKFDREGAEHSCLRVVGCESEVVGSKEVPLCCHIRAAAANQQWACPGTQELANHDANRKDASTLYALAGWSSKDETIRKKTTNWISTRSKHHVYSINQNHSKSIKIYHDLSGPKPRPIESNWSLLVGCWFLCHHRRPPFSATKPTHAKAIKRLTLVDHQAYGNQSLSVLTNENRCLWMFTHAFQCLQ